jgi:hypothetical protein
MSSTRSEDRRGICPARIALAVTAVVSGIGLLVHSLVQGVGAARYWEPCWSEGYDSAACSYLQHDAPSPSWLGPVWLWAVEVLLAVVVLVGTAMTRGRVRVAGWALGAAVASSLLVDHLLTPMVDGGYVSADSPPGSGLIGAVAMAVAGALLLVTAIPARAPRAAGSRAGRG